MSSLVITKIISWHIGLWSNGAQVEQDARFDQVTLQFCEAKIENNEGKASHFLFERIKLISKENKKVHSALFVIGLEDNSATEKTNWYVYRFKQSELSEKERNYYDNVCKNDFDKNIVKINYQNLSLSPCIMKVDWKGHSMIAHTPEEGCLSSYRGASYMRTTDYTFPNAKLLNSFWFNEDNELITGSINGPTVLMKQR